MCSEVTDNATKGHQEMPIYEVIAENTSREMHSFLNPHEITIILFDTYRIALYMYEEYWYVERQVKYGTNTL